MSGSGFDLSTSVFSEDGRIYQIEYSRKIIDNGDTVIGVQCKDGVILASEKLIRSRLMVEDSNRRIFNIEEHIGAVISGHIPDGKNVIDRARKEAQSYRDNYGLAIPGRLLADRVALYIHAHTLYSSYRPLGTALLISSFDEGVYSLYQILNSGECYKYFSSALGKGKQAISTEIEKANFSTLTVADAMPKIAKLICLAHNEAREKTYEFEASSISLETNNIHKIVPLITRNALVQTAEKEIEDEMMASD